MGVGGSVCPPGFFPDPADPSRARYFCDGVWEPGPGLPLADARAVASALDAHGWQVLLRVLAFPVLLVAGVLAFRLVGERPLAGVALAGFAVAAAGVSAGFPGLLRRAASYARLVERYREDPGVCGPGALGCVPAVSGVVRVSSGVGGVVGVWRDVGVVLRPLLR